MQLRCNTTGMRAMMETQLHKAVLEGDLSPQLQKTAFRMIGHSEKTARESYILTEMREDAHKVNGFHPPPPPPSSNNTNPTSTHSLIRSYTCLSIKVLEATRGIVAGDQYDDLTQLPSFKPAPSIPFNEAWGSNHQDNGKPELKRAVFSDKETYLIGKIYREMKNDDSNPDNFGGPIDTENTSQYYRILKTIRNDKELWPDFHPRHVIDATRIRPGLLKVSYSPLTLPFYYIFHFSYFPPRL